MGDRSPKDKEKKKKQHDKHVQDINRDRQPRPAGQGGPPGSGPVDPHKKAS